MHLSPCPVRVQRAIALAYTFYFKQPVTYRPCAPIYLSVASNSTKLAADSMRLPRGFHRASNAWRKNARSSETTTSAQIKEPLF
jgi:hypothetical protein